MKKLFITSTKWVNVERVEIPNKKNHTLAANFALLYFGMFIRRAD